VVKLNLSGHKNSALDEMGFVFPGVMHVDLADPQLPQKVAAFLGKIPGLDGSSPVVVALPGLSGLSAIILSVLHGMTGQFPMVQPLVRGEDGAFVPGPIMDLQGVRNDLARSKSRDGAIVL